MKASDFFKTTTPVYDAVFLHREDGTIETLKAKPVLGARDVATLGQRLAILAALRTRFDKRTTGGEINALYHAEENILNPVIFLTIVELWYRRMIERESSVGAR